MLNKTACSLSKPFLNISKRLEVFEGVYISRVADFKLDNHLFAKCRMLQFQGFSNASIFIFILVLTCNIFVLIKACFKENM